MNKSKINLPYIKLLIAHGLASGRSQREIAAILGTSQPSISRIARQNDVLEMMRKEEWLLVNKVEGILEELRKNPLIHKEF